MDKDTVELIKFIATTLITMVGTGFAAWVAAKYGVRFVGAQVEKVDKKVDDVTVQNKEQSDKIDNVHRELNSRLDQWKKEVEIHVLAVVEAASAKSYQAGVESERRRVPTVAESVVEAAKQEALDLIKKAQETADALIKDAAATIKLSPIKKKG